MKLLKPLALEEVQTGEVTLVPTKKFFKPVAVLSAPLTVEHAALLECSYLFDAAGNPHRFEGSHKLAGEVSGATIHFFSQQSGSLELVTEKIASVSLHVEEKTGMRIKFSAHLPEEQQQLLELLDFLAKLNKEKFDLTISEQQRSIFEALRTDGAETHPFKIMIGRKPAITGAVSVLEIDGQWVGGWECKGGGLNGEPAGGKALAKDNPRKSSPYEALQWANSELFFFVKQLEPNGPKEITAVGALADWCLELTPELKKDPEGAKASAASRELGKGDE